MIIFVGVAGSGKSVQGKLLANDLRYSYFSMGEFLRNHVSNDEIKQKMLKGMLVSDEETIETIEDAIEKNHLDVSEFILDGFPRTEKQAEWIVDQVKRNKFQIKAVIYLVASPEVVVDRLLNRKRPDDTPEVIESRMKLFSKAILPIVEILKSGGIKVYEINGEGRPDLIHKEIVKTIRG